MSAAHAEDLSDRMPNAIESENADQLRRVISSLAREDEPTTLQLALGKGETAEVTLSPAITQTFLDILRLVASGQGYRVVPVGVELTTQQSADLLNVSRPHLVSLLEAGEIPFAKVGRHRRVRAEDVLAYRARRDARRAEALAEMATEDAEADRL